MIETVTARAWKTPTHGGPRYGTDDTYRAAAAWLAPCATIADWGGGYGYFGAFVPTARYTVVEGTRHSGADILADLATYRAPSDGILIRHVLDNTPEWPAVLANALAAFRHRMVVITFTPPAETTAVVKLKSGWPITHFNPDDLRRAMGTLLVHDEGMDTSHPERLYYLERR